MEQEDGLIDRYLNNGLNDVERAAFEIMMLEDEQLFACVQMLDAFKSALVEESSAPGAQREFRVMSFRSWVQQPLSLVASVLVAGLGLQVGYDALTLNDATQAGGGIGSLFVIEATRGAGEVALSGTAPYLFQIDAGPDAANTAVAVTLRDAGGIELLSVEDLQVDTNGWARVVVEQTLTGAYTLELVSADAPAVRSFDISVH